MKSVKVAVAQAAPVLFDKALSVKKACNLVKEAGNNGSKVVLLPEAFIPAYPRGLSFGMVVGSRSPEGRSLWKRYWDNAIETSGLEVEALGKAAKEAGVYLGIGVIERDGDFSGGTLYCTLLYFGPDGKLLGKHRKLKPTGSERLIWGEGDGSTMPVFETNVGKIGGLICWENYMPLARMAMYGKGVEIYLAPTADSRETWQATMRHIACEGRCFVLGCNQFVTKDMYPSDLVGLEELDNQHDIICRGGSIIVSPTGEILAGPLFDEEGILYANLDMSEIAKGKLDFDVVGHYARPDIFQLNINTEPQVPVSYEFKKRGGFMIRYIQSKAVPESAAPFSQVVLDDHYAHLAGLVAADFPEGQAVIGNVGEETRSVLKIISKILEEIGLDMSQIVRTDLHLSSLDDFDEMDAAYREFFEVGHYPARTTTESPRLFGGSRVEITCMARLK